MPRQRNNQLNLFLLKSEVQAFNDAIKENLPNTAMQLTIRRELGIEGVVILDNPTAYAPRWQQFLAEGISEDIHCCTKHVRAVVLVRITFEGRRQLMALTFGHGRALLKQDTFVDDFGLKIALNALNPTSLRAIDLRTISEIPRTARQNASRLSPISEFSLHKMQDVLTKVVGIPQDVSFARSISGGISVSIKSQISFADLPAKCEELLRYYHSTTYRSHFGWVDYLKIVRDKSEVQRLNHELVTRINDTNVVDILLAIPEPENWDDIEGFTYNTERNAREPHNDLDMLDFLGTITDPATIDIHDLKRKYAICEHMQNGTRIDDRWTVYDCIVWHYEPPGQTAVYILYCGTWHRLEKSFVDQVNEFVASIPVARLVLPSAMLYEKEQDYNIRCAQATGLVNMDRRLYETGDGRIEVCDLFSRERRFIHIKRGGASSAHSHLFSQASVSAGLFLRDANCRQFIRNILLETGDEADIEGIVPTAKPNSVDYEIVFAVISPENRYWPNDFPFLTKLSLQNACNGLQAFNVSVLHINQQTN